MKFSLKSVYFRHIATILSGTAAAQLILFAATPLLSRLYSPADFGVYAVFLALTAVLGVVASGRYEIAILLPRSDDDALGLLRICLLISTVFAFACLILILLWDLSPYLKNSEAYQIRYWIPGAVWLQGFWQAYTNFGNRHRQYKSIVFSRITGSIGTVGATLIFAFWGFAAVGLIAGKLIGQFMETSMLFFFQKSMVKTSNAELKGLFIRYRNMLRFSTLEGLLNTCFKQIPIIALSSWFSLNAAGHFSMTQNVLGKPSGLLSSAIGQVFFQQAAMRHHEGENLLRLFFIKNLRLLIGMILLPSLVVIFWGKIIFAWLLGSEWLEAGIYASWLMPFVAITFVKSPLSCIIDIKNQIRQNLLFEVSFFLLSIFAFFLGVRGDNALLGIQVFSIGNSILGLIQLFWFYRLTKLQGGF